MVIEIDGLITAIQVLGNLRPNVPDDVFKEALACLTVALNTLYNSTIDKTTNDLEQCRVNDNVCFLNGLNKLQKKLSAVKIDHKQCLRNQSVPKELSEAIEMVLRRINLFASNTFNLLANGERIHVDK